jgi:hypothetical protein
MKLRSLTLSVGTLALAAAFSQAAFAQGYDRAASARAAQSLAQDASAMAPQTPPDQAMNPATSITVASQPVPDTRANRAAFGQPLSRAGKRTAPIGD